MRQPLNPPAVYYWGEAEAGLGVERDMSAEVEMLAWSVVLGLVHVVLSSHAKSLQYGYRWAASPRDGDMPPLAPVPGRLDRALRNFLETFPFFAAALLAAEVQDIRNGLTWWGAQLYFWGRFVYLPLYASGLPLVRSLIWNVATLGIILILLALLLAR